jgi:type II secretory pathway predicted ATPase ExeA/cell division protein FtsN
VSGNYAKGPKSLVELSSNTNAVVPFQQQPDTLAYEPFFRLNEKPFSLNADPRFDYDSPAFAATRQGLLAGIRRREGLLVLTGEIGTGKTTLCRAALADLGRKTFSSIVPDPFASREDLLKMLLIDFGVLSIQELIAGRLAQASRTELGYLLSEFLESLTPDAFAVVIIDEAQNLSLPLIEETRILADTFGTLGRLQIVFVGQPELHAKLKLPEMRQVDQRVCGYHRLAPLGREAVDGYIQHRLQAAGGRRDRVLFVADVVDRLHMRTGGVPRLINRVCDRALHLAFAQRADCVTLDVLETALIEVGSATLSPTWDSIMFAQSAVPPPAPAGAPDATPPAPAPEAQPLPPPELAEYFQKADPEDFHKELDQWVEQDLPASRKLTPVPPALTDVPAAAGRSSRRRRTPPGAATEWPRDRSETYMQRIWRIWAKRAAIAAVAFVTLTAGMVAASLRSQKQGPPSLPVVEAIETSEPAAALPVPQPASSQPEAPVPPAPVTASLPAASVGAAVAPTGEYLVVVGLFARQERADQLVDTLTQAGLPAMQRPFQLRNQTVQQLVLGPFFSRADAVSDLARLKALGGYDDALVIEP